MLFKNYYFVIGGVPEPSGGVTIFNGDLVEYLKSFTNKIVIFDQNRGKKQSRFSDLLYFCIPYFKGFPYHIIVFLLLILSRPKRIILHCSTYIGIIRILPAIILNVPCAIFIYTGSIPRSKLSKLFRFLLSLIDRVFVIAPSYYTFLLKSGLDEKKIFNIPPIVTPLVQQKITSSKKKFSTKTFVTCGHMTSIYNFEYSIRILELYPNSELHIFYYGPTHTDKKYFESLKSMPYANRTFYHFAQSREVFINFLSKSHLFLRTNFIDSYGVSVYDALSNGVPCVGSNVCERFPGCLIYESKKYEDFVEKVAMALNSDTQSNFSMNSLSSFDNVIEMIKSDFVI